MKFRRLLTLFALSLPAASYAVPGVPLTPWIQKMDAFRTTDMRPHPRLLLTPSEQVRVRKACQLPEEKPYWDAVRRFVDQAKSTPVPADPAGFPGGVWTIDEWRRIVDAGGDAENHVMSAAFAWVVTQDPSDLAEAKRWTLGIAKWDPHGPSAIEGVDHSAQTVLHALALSYDWLYDQWTPTERAELQKCIVERCKGFYKHLNPYIYDSWNNHAWFQTTAMVEGALAVANEVPEADTWWRYGSKLYLTEYLPLGGQDGDWHEGTHYVSYTLIFVYQWADALRSATGIDAYQVPWLKEVGYFRMYTHPPRSGGIKFNDNNFTGPDTWDRMTACNAAKNTGDPTLQWYADMIQTGAPNNPMPAMMTLIYRDPDLKDKAPGGNMPLGKWYRDSGWVVMRTNLADSNDTQFGMKCGPHLAEKGGKGHDHPDQNHFLINAGGDQLAVDSGYYDYYGSPQHNNWEFTPKAHNTILVNGVEQLIAPEKPSKVMSFVSLNNGMDFVEGEAANAYPKGTLNSWRRQVLFIRPDVFVVRDIIKPVKPSKITWMLHGPAEYALKGQDFRTDGVKYALSGRIVEPAGLTVSQWGGFPADAQPERKKPGAFPDQWHLTADTPSEVKDTVGLIVMKVGPKETVTTPKVERTSNGSLEVVTVGEGAGRTECVYSSAAGTWSHSGYTSNARVLAASFGGPVAKLLASHATTVRSGRGTVWASSVPSDVSMQIAQTGVKTLSVRTDADAKIAFRCTKPRAVRVDGKPVQFRYDVKAKSVALSLGGGTHRIDVQ